MILFIFFFCSPPLFASSSLLHFLPLFAIVLRLIHLHADSAQCPLLPSGTPAIGWADIRHLGGVGGVRRHQEDEELFSRQSGSSRLFIFCLLCSQSEEEIQSPPLHSLFSSFPALTPFPHNYYLLLFSPLTCTYSSSHSSLLPLILPPHSPTNIRAAQKYSNIPFHLPSLGGCRNWQHL